MTFPHYFHLFGARVHPHALMELIAYTGGFQLYLFLRRREARRAVPFELNMWIIVGCVFGALVGSKLLAWIESAPDYWPHRFEPQAWLGGKTIVGGLLGGWAGVEISKRLLHVTRSTGDLFVYPLILGQCIGRIGCFLTGLPDHTYGNPTHVPWAVDFGDGPRHPTQLYEIFFLLLLGCGIWVSERRFGPFRGGVRFRLYMLGYLLFRFCIEFIKPVFAPYGGLSAIQLASLCGAVVCLTHLLTGRGLDPADPERQVEVQTPAIEVTG
jgi:prolipoprotein diacylglyceryltransferase